MIKYMCLYNYYNTKKDKNKGGIFLNKKEERNLMLNIRNNLDPELRKIMSKRIFDHLKSLSEYKRAKNIMCFISFGSEVDTHGFVKDCLKEGKKIIVPISLKDTKELFLQEIKNFDELKKGSYGILEPQMNPQAEFPKEDLDLIIVPGLIFDKYGFRIGYGGGYYDRLFCSIEKFVCKIAVGFEIQYIDKGIERNKYDRPVDYFVSEKGIRKF